MNGALALNKEDGISCFPHVGLASPLPVLCDFSLPLVQCVQLQCCFVADFLFAKTMFTIQDI